MLLAFLSAITVTYAATVADDEGGDRPCAVYMYPATLEDIAGYQVHGLPRNTELIYKVFKVADNGSLVRVMDDALLHAMQERFREFRHTWLIDKGFYEPSVRVDGMRPNIVTLQEALEVFRPARMSLDLEPIVREDGLNLMPFHTQLIGEINHLGLPVSVYLGCSKLIRAIGMEEYQNFRAALQQPGNSVVLDAYCWGNECKHGNACGRNNCINDGEGQCVVTPEAPHHQCLMHRCNDTHDDYTNPGTLAMCVGELVKRGINFQLALMIVRKPTEAEEQPWVYRSQRFLEASLQRAQSRGLAELPAHEFYLGPVFFHFLSGTPIPDQLIPTGTAFRPGSN